MIANLDWSKSQASAHKTVLTGFARKQEKLSKRPGDLRAFTRRPCTGRRQCRIYSPDTIRNGSARWRASFVHWSICGWDAPQSLPYIVKPWRSMISAMRAASV